MRRMPFPSHSAHLWLLIILSGLLTLPLAVVGCGPASGVPGAGTQATLAPCAGRTPSPNRAPCHAAAPPLIVPAGWTQVLPGLILSDTSHFNTLMTSAAKPGRVAACALPPHPWPAMAAPVFVVSDDGGRTWQRRAIPLAGSVWECFLRGDILNPDTYAASMVYIKDGKAGGPDETLVTQDAGRTWHLGAMPASMEYSCATLPQQLNMPGWVYAYPCTVDPWDPTHLYTFIPTSPSTASRGLRLYETRDGGSSWHPLHIWPTALRLMEIHPTSSGLYVVDGQDGGGGQGVYRSADGGVTWKQLPLQGAVRGIEYFGSAGRLLTTAYPQLFQVDPVTGEPTPLGEVPVTKEPNGSVDGVISSVAICEDGQPSLVVAGPYGTFVRSLPPLH